MKCIACDTVYDDNRTICPNCGCRNKTNSNKTTMLGNDFSGINTSIKNDSAKIKTYHKYAILGRILACAIAFPILLLSIFDLGFFNIILIFDFFNLLIAFFCLFSKKHIKRNMIEGGIICVLENMFFNFIVNYDFFNIDTMFDTQEKFNIFFGIQITLGVLLFICGLLYKYENLKEKN